MTDRCKGCGTSRITGYTGKLDQKCRRCGAWFPPKGSVTAPNLRPQLNGPSPFGVHTSLGDILAIIRIADAERNSE